MNTSLTGKVEGARSEAPDVVDKPPPPCSPTGPSPRACGGRPSPYSWSSCAVSAPARHCRRRRSPRRLSLSNFGVVAARCPLEVPSHRRRQRGDGHIYGGAHPSRRVPVPLS